MLKEELIKILENDMIIAYENGIVSRDYTEKNALEIIDAFDKMHQENQQLKQQNEFLMKQDNILQSLMQWLYEQEKYANDDESIILEEDKPIIEKINDFIGATDNELMFNIREIKNKLNEVIEFLNRKEDK